jgi:hypothetical protein
MPKVRNLVESTIKKYEGRDYFNHISKINNVTIKIVDFEEIGFTNHAHEVIKSDYLRYYVLYKYGGVWSDFDIIYISSIENKILSEKESVIFRDYIGNHEYYPIAFFLAKPNNKFFGHLLNNIDKTLNYFKLDYQTIGSYLFKKLLIDNRENIKNFDLEILPAYLYLPYNCTEISSCLLSLEDKISNHIHKINQDVFRIHWFNGDPNMKSYINNLDKSLESNTFFIKYFLDIYVNQYFKVIESPQNIK